jgi:hypothetical protein
VTVGPHPHEIKTHSFLAKRLQKNDGLGKAMVLEKLWFLKSCVVFKRAISLESRFCENDGF